MIRFHILGLSLLCTTALSAQAPRTHDSAGVRIVENGPRGTAPVLFHLGDKPLYDVGGLQDTPDNEFDARNGYLRGVRLSDGGFVAIDKTRLQYFDAKGKRARIVGRKGQGPEEYLQIDTICRTRGDTVVVMDGNNRRVTALTRTGAFARSVPTTELGYLGFTSCFDDGSILFIKSLPYSPGAARPILLTRFALGHATSNTLLQFSMPPADGLTYMEPAAVASGKHVYYGNGVSSEIKVAGIDGKLGMIIRWADPALPITDAQVEAHAAASIPRSVSAEERSQRMSEARTRPHASHWPAFGRIHADPAGTLWVEDFRVDIPSAVGWTAFDAQGKLVGRLVFPVPAAGKRIPQVIGFGVNEMVGLRYDDDGAPHLTVYSLVRDKE